MEFLATALFTYSGIRGYVNSYNLIHSIPTVDSNSNGYLLHQRSGVSENGQLSCRCSSGSISSMPGNGAMLAELQNCIEETRLNGHQMPLGTKGFVNKSDIPKTNTQLDIVNNSENSSMQPQLKFVNNNSEYLQTGYLLEEDEGDEYDQRMSLLKSHELPTPRYSLFLIILMLKQRMKFYFLSGSGDLERREMHYGEELFIPEGALRKEVLGHVDEEEVRKLRRCLVGEMAGVCSVGSIVGRLHNWGLGEIRVQRLRGNFFLLTIEDEDLFFMLEDLQWSYLKEIFVDVKLWTETLSHKERVVWLEIDGLPLQCWNEITLKRLVGLWGKFEAYGENVKHHIDCEKVNMMISTTIEARIDEVVDVVVENQKFGVRVLEVGMLDNSVAKLPIFENNKNKHNGVEKVGEEIGAIKVGVASEYLSDDKSEASSTGCSAEKKGITKISGGAFNVSCTEDSLGDCSQDFVGKPSEGGCSLEEGRESEGFQIQNISINEGVQGVGDVGVESKALGADEVIIFNDGVSILNDRDRDVGAVVGVAENGLSSHGNKAIEDSSGMGLSIEGLMDFNCVSWLALGENNEGIKVGNSNPRRITRDTGKSNIKEKKNSEHFGGDCGEEPGVPEISWRKKNKKSKKFGSLMDIQDKVLSKAERKRRDRALKRLNLKKSDLITSELSGRTLSDSDLKRRKADAFVKAEKTLELGKILGIKFVGSESEIIKDLESLDMC
ncbi:Detected protein of unknown function [Hibiscus syriacus]|uniref:Uncharacterized protein n=1 Tax=Hibiscus syriacus TaxID=106335 RepID=A0A6A2YZA1_HIBSY|nr:Detected protein of unknown function [Hibiscus syriacus]